MKLTIKTNLILLIALIALQFSCKKNQDNNAAPTPTNNAFTLTSIAVENGLLLSAYKCEPKVNGIEKSIPLSWSNVPATAKTLAICMIHYPVPTDTSNVSTYLTLWNIDKSVTGIPYGTANNGPWYMGANKDGNVISYTSPCSAGPGTHTYYITIYALSATPVMLPSQNSLSVNYKVLRNALSTVTIIDKATLTFNSITP